MAKLGTNKSVSASNVEDVDRMDYSNLDLSQIVIPGNIQDGSVESRLRAKLKAAGVDQLIREIIVCRFIYEMSMSEIRDELGVASALTVHKLLQRGLDHLKEVGFSHEDETLS